MSRDNFRRGNKNRNNWNSKNSHSGKNFQNKQAKNNENPQSSLNSSFKSSNFQNKKSITPEMQKQIEENENAIKEFKSNVVLCELCGEPVLELASALKNKTTGNPVHFDCVLKKIAEKENLSPQEKVTYIGNGKFAILHFENVHDMRHFSIVKEIEWEERDSKRGEWRDEMSTLFSQIK
ncbi:hypothetical protein [Treponema pectinovorum]|uniref:hypothetical protein n=1 Tax=Treponema pectinovorum TaxID=164 RepID=UPI0011CC6108|nr:hypothetical protein [Treponema pectinovorum]